MTHEFYRNKKKTAKFKNTPYIAYKFSKIIEHYLATIKVWYKFGALRNILPSHATHEVKKI